MDVFQEDEGEGPTPKDKDKIAFTPNFNEIKYSIVEQFNRTLRGRMWKYLNNPFIIIVWNFIITNMINISVERELKTQNLWLNDI